MTKDSGRNLGLSLLGCGQNKWPLVHGATAMCLTFTNMDKQPWAVMRDPAGEVTGWGLG